jgi:hypothetical protein
MNPFKAFGRGAKKVVTAPVKAAAAAGRFARAQKEAFDVWRHTEKAEQDPALYRSVGWWKKLLAECGDLWAVLPIPKETRAMLNGAMLSGYKTYIVAGLAGALTIAHALGYIDSDGYATLMALLGAGGVATVRAAIAKSTPPAEK